MSQLVKTKRQANFKGFKRLGAFKGLVEQKNVVFNSFKSPGIQKISKQHSIIGNRSNNKNSIFSVVCVVKFERLKSKSQRFKKGRNGVYLQ
jgi:hypothetical protein